MTAGGGGGVEAFWKEISQLLERGKVETCARIPDANIHNCLNGLTQRVRCLLYVFMLH
jgi:hypothetical protein